MEEAAASDVRIGQNMKNLEKADSWKALLAGDAVTRRFRYQRRIDGEWRWTELVAHSFREQCTETSYALLYLKDIDAQVRKEQAQKEAANRDPLTGVLNRNAFESAVREYMEAPESQRRGAMILLDIDNFKNVNDRLGHPEGDNVLRYVTKLLTATFRQQDVIGRLGGDEFVVFVQAPSPGRSWISAWSALTRRWGRIPKRPSAAARGSCLCAAKDFPTPGPFSCRTRPCTTANKRANTGTPTPIPTGPAAGRDEPAAGRRFRRQGLRRGVRRSRAR